MPAGRRRNPGPPALAVAAALLSLLLAAGWWIQRQPRLAAAAGALQGGEVSARAFGAGGLGRALRRLELVHPLPPPLEPAADVSGFDLRAFAFERPPRYATRPLPRSRLSEALLIDPAWLERRVAVVSLLMQPEDLGVFADRPQARGREWERRGYLAYVEDGELRFASWVGVRRHGGWTRTFPAAYQSYRIYFRSRHGHDRLPAPLFAGREDDPLTELVLRRDGGLQENGEHWYFTGPLAFDVARRIGVPAPHTRHALLFVNGLPMGVRAVTEFIQRDYLRARFGVSDPVLVRTKPAAGQQPVREGDPAVYRRFVERVRSRPSVGWIRSEVDVDNLYRWALAVLFCATGDLFQGTLVKDQVAGSRWFWVAWDMDDSFGVTDAAGWQRDTFNRLVGRARRDLRSNLLFILLANETERRTFLHLATEALNHRLTERFLEERWRHYRAQAQVLGIGAETETSLARMREFLERRRAMLAEQLAARLVGRPAHRVTVTMPAGHSLLIDGRPWRGGYAGWYPEGMEIELALPAPERAGFSHWAISGSAETPTAASLRRAVDGELTIAAVFNG